MNRSMLKYYRDKKDYNICKYIYYLILYVQTIIDYMLGEENS